LEVLLNKKMRFAEKNESDNFWIPGIIIISGILIRMIKYLDIDLWYDEALQIYECYTFGFNQYDALIMHPPLNNMVLLCWLKISNSLVWIKLLPVIWGTCALVMVYLVARQLYDRSAGLWALVVMTVLPFHVYYSRDLRVYSFVAFLVIFTWFAFLKLEEQNNVKWFTILMIAATLAFYSHYFAIFPLTALGICSLLLIPKNKKILLATGSLILAVVLYTPWLFKLYQATNIMMKDSHFFPPQLSLKYMARICLLLVGGYNGRVIPTIIAAVTVFCLLIYVFHKSDYRQRVLISGLIILPVLLIYCVGVVMHYNYLIVRYIIFMTPAIAIVSGVGISKFKGKYALIPGLLIIIPGIIGIGYTYEDDFNGLELDQGVRPRKEFSEPAAFIASNWHETDVVAHSCVSSFPSLYYYLTVKNQISAGFVIDLDGRYGKWFRETWNVGDYIDNYPWAQPVNYESILEGHDRMWFIASEFDIDVHGTFDTDFMYSLRKNLLSRYKLLDYQYFYGCPVYLLDLTSEIKQ